MTTKRPLTLFGALALALALGMALAWYATPFAQAAPTLSVGRPSAQLTLTPMGTHQAAGDAEIVSYDPMSQRMFVTVPDTTIEVIDISNPMSPTLAYTISVAAYGSGINSVDVKDGVVAAAVAADPEQDPGVVVFFDTDGNFLNSVPTGALPDMVTFTPNGKYVLTADEGEPNDDYTVDPEGSVTIIDISGGVAAATATTVGFTDFNVGGPRHDEFDTEIRIFGPGATIAQDLEPEYIAVSGNSRQAFVTLQENNAVAVIDIRSADVAALVALGTKDHSLLINALDASNEDGLDGEGAINIATWPVNGFYMPDAIAAYKYQGQTYIVTANEGDARDYDGYSEETRIGDLVLDPDAFPDAAFLQDDANLGRLKTTTANGDTDNDGDFDVLYSYGARSFSIWDSAGNLVYDSGDGIAQITASLFPDLFNSQGSADSFDSRSDDKGAEPEAITIGKVRGRNIAFIGLERIGGILAYDVTNPYSPSFLTYQREPFTDQAPEGLKFVHNDDSPIENPLLLVANEVSGTVTVFEIDVQILGNGVQP